MTACAWCGYTASHQCGGHEEPFCSMECNDAWHYEEEEQRHAEAIMDDWENDYGDRNR